MCGFAIIFPCPLHATAPILISMSRALNRCGSLDEEFVLIHLADDHHLEFSGAQSESRVLELIFSHSLASLDDRFSGCFLLNFKNRYLERKRTMGRS